MRLLHTLAIIGLSLTAIVAGLGVSSASADFLTWGSLGSGPGQFNEPGSLSITPDGNVLVGELAGERVQEFKADGTYVREIPGPIGQVFSVLATADGGLWVDLDTGDNKHGLKHFSSAGGLDNTADNSTIPILNPSCGSSPSCTTYLTVGSVWVSGLAISHAGGLLVADTQLCSVTEFNDSTDPATAGTSLGERGTAPGKFGCPGFYDGNEPESGGYLGLAVAPDGDIFVGDTANERIEQFTSDGSYAGDFLVPGADGQGYLGVGADSEGNVYVTTKCEVQKFSPAGVLLGIATPPQQACNGRLGIAVTAPNVVYVTNLMGPDTVTRVDPSFSVGLSGPSGSTAPGCLSGGAVALTASGPPPPFATITDYSWSTGTGATIDTGSSPTLNVPCGATGTQLVGVIATSSLGDTAKATIAVNVALPPPTPPGGIVGVSIDSGDYATNDPQVTLNVVWPLGASQLLVSNDGGFGAAGGTATVAVAAEVPWTLQQTGAERLPKTVYVRFLGAGINTQNFTDDIILDQTAPTLQSAQLVSGASTNTAFVARTRLKTRTYRVKVKAHDKIVGVCAVEASAKKSGGTIAIIRNCRDKGIVSLDKTVTIKSATPPKYARVRNSAGDWSRWLGVKK